MTRKFNVRDKRRPLWFSIDNVFLRGGYAHKVGPTGLAVYAGIALHVNLETQSGYPSHDTIARLTGMSQRQVARKVKELRDLNIIATTGEQGEVLTYHLLSREDWLPVPPVPEGMTDRQGGYDHQAQGGMTDRHTNKPHDNKPHEEDAPPETFGLFDGEKEPPITVGEKTPGDPLEAVHAHAKKKPQLDNTRPKEWRNTSDGAYGLCRRFADLFRDGALPWSDGDIEKSITAAERMIIHFGGDARKAKRVLDEFHADCDGDPGHGCTTLYSLRNALPDFVADQKKGAGKKGDRTVMRNGKKVTVLRQ